jgi:hypothetical protein
LSGGEGIFKKHSFIAALLAFSSHFAPAFARLVEYFETKKNGTHINVCRFSFCQKGKSEAWWVPAGWNFDRVKISR